jgi:hypothetical protein
VSAEQLSLAMKLRTTFRMACIICTREFHAERSTRKTCSSECRQKLYREKRAGRYTKSPEPLTVTRAVQGTNADLLAAAAHLYIPDGALVADVTYGKGIFWRATKRRRFTLITSDLMTKADLRADFRRLPYPDEVFDVVVLDPPYVHMHHPRRAMHGRYNGGASLQGSSVDDIVALYRAGMTEAARVLKPRGRLFVKTMDQVENGKTRWLSRELPDFAEQQLNMWHRDNFPLVANTTPRFKRWARQFHARKDYSYLLVFERLSARHGSGRPCRRPKTRSPIFR